MGFGGERSGTGGDWSDRPAAQVDSEHDGKSVGSTSSGCEVGEDEICVPGAMERETAR